LQPDELQKSTEAEMAIATETLRAGEDALHEKDVRRIGPAVSVIFVGITILAIWALIFADRKRGSPPCARPVPGAKMTPTFMQDHH
jgi:hypothetical protein